MFYGYLDESGAPGIATRPNDYLVVSLVVFPDKESAEKCSRAIDAFREKLKLPVGYEFHYSRNSTRPRTEFVRLIPNLDFQFITIAIRKTGSRLHASYPKIAEYLLDGIARRFPEIQLEMDPNPALYAELRGQTKRRGLHIKYKQAKSTNHNLIQLADYIVAMSTRKLKGTAKGIEQYRPLTKRHQIYFGDTTA
jgi:hypothetical protein